MVAYWLGVSKMSVRVRPLHPLFFLLSCFFLVISASAFDFDVDDSLYYHLTLEQNPVMPFAVLRGDVFETTFRFNSQGKITSINGYSLSDMTFDTFGTIYANSLSSIYDTTESLSNQIQSINSSSITVNDTLDLINSNLLSFFDYFKGKNFSIYWTNSSGVTSKISNLSFADYLMYLSTHIESQTSLIRNSITSLQSNLQSTISNSLLPIQSSLNTYLPRIDTNTENLHGDNLNLLSKITSSFNTNHSDLSNVNSNLNNVKNTLDSSFAVNHSDLFTLNSNLVSFLNSNHNDLGIVSDDINNFHSFFTNGNFSIYWTNGAFQTSRLTNLSFPDYLSYLSSSLAHNFSHVNSSLVGADESAIAAITTIDKDGNIVSQGTSFHNILDILGYMNFSLQTPLAKLQYVLANDDDIKLRAEVQGNLDAFDDQFTGSGPGSVSPSDISGIGGISGSLKSSFEDSAKASDTFYVINSNDSYQFFSQEVSDSLDTVNSPASYRALDSDFWIDDFVADEDGYMSLKKKSDFDPFDFLRGDSD